MNLNECKAEVMRFAVVGLLATGMHYGLYLLLVLWMNVKVAYSVGYIISFIVNYFLSNYFTFKTKPEVKNGIGFALSHLVNFGLHLGLLNFFLYLGIGATWAPLFVFSIAIPVNFILVRLALKGVPVKGK